jgi:hypothetical protein
MLWARCLFFLLVILRPFPLDGDPDVTLDQFDWWGEPAPGDVAGSEGDDALECLCDLEDRSNAVIYFPVADEL